MIIIKNMLKKHDINKFKFVKYLNKDDEIHSLIVEINELEVYDLINKKLITNLGFFYKKPLTDYIMINENRISSIKAKRLAKPFHKKFFIYCEEQEELKHPTKSRLKTKVEHSNPETTITY